MNVIYILKHELCESISFKIGRTSNIKNRLSQFKNIPGKVKLYRLFPTNFSNQIEKILHKEFLLKRDKGEWFKLNEADIFQIEDIIEEQNELFKRKRVAKS